VLVIYENSGTMNIILELTLFSILLYVPYIFMQFEKQKEWYYYIFKLYGNLLNIMLLQIYVITSCRI
jgi:hypothetical protein